MIDLPKLELLINNRQPICVGREMAKSSQWYLKLERENINILQLALDSRNFNLLIRLGNQLYNHGSSFGFPYISSIGKRIEIAATKQDIAFLSALINVLRRYLQNVSVVSM